MAKRDRLGDGLKDELEELHAMAIAAAGISIATNSSGLGTGDHAANRPAKENPAQDTEDAPVRLSAGGRNGGDARTGTQVSFTVGIMRNAGQSSRLETVTLTAR